MKILMIGNKQLATGFTAAGHEVCALVLPSDVSHSTDSACAFYSEPASVSTRILECVDTFKPDLIMQNDHSGPLIHTGLDQIAIPKIWYAIDVHLHGDWYRHYAPCFDRVYCAQQNKVAFLSKWHRDVVWLPLYCSEDVSPLEWNKRDIDIAFVGKIESRFNPERKRFFDELKALGVRVYVASGAWAPLYRRSKIVINNSVHDDLNLRFFEAPGCGAFLITDELTHSMSDILIPGQDYLHYQHADARSCAEKIRWVFTHEYEAAAMAQRAFQKIRSSHLDRHRAQQITTWFQTKKKIHHLPEEEITAHLAWAFWYLAGMEYPDTLIDFFKCNALSNARKALNRGERLGFPQVILADDALNHERYNEAAAYISSLTVPIEDDVCAKRMMKVRIIIEMVKGNYQRAYHLCTQALRRYGNDPVFTTLENSIREKVVR